MGAVLMAAAQTAKAQVPQGCNAFVACAVSNDFLVLPRFQNAGQVFILFAGGAVLGKMYKVRLGLL